MYNLIDIKSALGIVFVVWVVIFARKTPCAPILEKDDLAPDLMYVGRAGTLRVIDPIMDLREWARRMPESVWLHPRGCSGSRTTLMGWRSRRLLLPTFVSRFLASVTHSEFT